MILMVYLMYLVFHDLGQLSSSFLDFEYTKIFLGLLCQPWKFLNFSGTSALVTYKLVPYHKKECIY